MARYVVAESAGGQPPKRQLRKWWKESSVYQVYPASFQDSTGSGVGDLKGIIDRVDHFKSLGVDIVWLCPIFESPQIDMGYDISNYKKIHEPYGTVADVDTLKDKLHERGMKLVLDLVVNHTSDQHEWFKQSRSSKDSPYRDWYIWRKPKYDAQGNRQPPNNWASHFQGSAWEYDEATDEYYLRLFAREQPDLNWENPKVRAAVHDIMRFWLDKGADGFRLDVINFVSKPQDFPDSKQEVLPGSELYSAGPRLHEYLKELGAILHEYDAFSVGEMPCVRDLNEVIKSVNGDRGELSMIFHFEFVDIDIGPHGKFSAKEWDLAELKGIANKWQRFMYDHDGWNALYLENHDQPRSVSRFANDAPQHRVDSAKVVAMFQALQAGTPFVYQGQEIGMVNVPKEWPMEEYKDIDCLNHWNLHKDSKDKEYLKFLKSQYQKKSRDNARTPMQWTAAPNAGFTTPQATPWMTVHPNHTEINVAVQVSDPASVFNFWKMVLATRKRYLDIFVYGDFALVDEKNEKILAYARRAEDGAVAVVACNFSSERVSWEGLKAESVKEVLVSNGGKTVEDFSGGKVEFGPYEGAVVLLA
ncbi:trehalose-6-phosphate hydrolase [Colletotrichum scovillei]|uniref:Trehalose-6-phosphate hydrolase n=1 Tax=Colletotrichum scovillei TaxID=1209932 RepID=A0A9P7R817_9PEZI|nr:trehalose-6-phosphate hydrolase [Colletotrichum scovillei]KAG7069244.1 trehalose-6-phosphate hydrolase [Colletotrichum scovillei]KAG7073222.1 trehalose-6-phosphate hydrolase [Colletotrichum scovillei]